MNTLNNPNLPDYQPRGLLRLQTQIQTQQIQEPGALHQLMQSQTQLRQQLLQNQKDTRNLQIHSPINLNEP
ncbi:DUF2756 domain-containing protein [Salmonella enterica subsp. enterica serovar Kottbus]|nr:hypothetical protein [Salmonella enterica subsp. enterica serovar Newport]EBY2753802.1 DUF2756 domain-containing protein [Salmonella enterica subsp. enterica serovar Kottbus]EHN5889129.1 DUF2756 domain-containing protein [Salmonella enterica subsp. enterica serovar Newport]